VHGRQSKSVRCKAAVRKAPIPALSEREPGEEKHDSEEPEHSFCTQNSLYPDMRRKSSARQPTPAKLKREE
jgi:hypothetical protein